MIGFSSAGFIGDALFAQGAANLLLRAAEPPVRPTRSRSTRGSLFTADNTATVYIGYVELGQGSTTSLLQISAEELDLDMGQVSTIRLDTNLTPNQGGTYSSSSIARGSPAIRTAAAEARQALLQMASKKLGAPVERMTVSQGRSVRAHRRQGSSVTYGELVGDKPFNLAFTGKAPLKPVADYKLVGTRPARNDIPGKVSGTYVYLQHVRLPGMLHGRVVRPRGQGAYGAGAKVATLDETSIAHIPGARVVRKGDFVGVVAEREWDAVRAARDLKITWDMPATLPGSDGLYAAMRAEKTTDHVVLERGDMSPAFAAAAHVASGTYHGAVPGARAVWAEWRARGRHAGFRARHLLDAGCLRHAQHSCRHPRPAAAKSARAVLRRLRHLRPQLLRRRRAGRRDPFAACGKAGAPAVHALGRARLGPLRPGARG